MSEFLGRLDFVYYISGFCILHSPEDASIMPDVREILLLSAEHLSTEIVFVCMYLPLESENHR